MTSDGAERPDRRAVLLTLGAAASSPGVARAQVRAAPPLRIELGAYPQLAAWAQSARSGYAAWWPRLAQALTSPEFHAPAAVAVIAAPLPDEAPAETEGAAIYVNGPYLLRTGEGPNLVAHELVHVVQAYPGKPSGWLTEGIADWGRYYLLLPADPARRFDPARADWRRGYQPAAALLAWCETRRSGTVQAVNAALRRGEDGEAALTARMGAAPDALWRAYLAARPTG